MPLEESAFMRECVLAGLLACLLAALPSLLGLLGLLSLLSCLLWLLVEANPETD